MTDRMAAGGRLLALGLVAALALGSAAARAADRHEVVAGWTLDDVGGKPGDDSDRSVSMRKSLPQVTLSYSPGESGSSGSIQVKFNRCRGLSYGSGFTFDDPPSSHAAQVRKQIDEAFADFAESCRGGDQDKAALMQGFDQAFQAIEAWMKERPFVYPPDQPGQPDGSDTPDNSDAPGNSSEPAVPMI